jgi:hypothetical protein
MTDFDLIDRKIAAGRVNAPTFCPVDLKVR